MVLKIVLVVYLFAIAISALLPDPAYFRKTLSLPFYVFYSAARLLVTAATFGKVKIPRWKKRVSKKWKASVSQVQPETEPAAAPSWETVEQPTPAPPPPETAPKMPERPGAPMKPPRPGSAPTEPPPQTPPLREQTPEPSSPKEQPSQSETDDGDDEKPRLPFLK